MHRKLINNFVSFLYLALLAVLTSSLKAAGSLIAKFNENARKLSNYRESGVTENPATKKLVSEQQDLIANIILILESNGQYNIAFQNC